MTRLEKIDLIRELNPFYKTNSKLFAMTEKELDKEIIKYQYKKQQKEIISLQEQVYALQAENLILKDENKALKKKLKRIGEISNAEN